MRKIFYILSILTITVPAFAEGENPAVDKTKVYASAAYVDGAYNAIVSAKQEKLTSTNVTTSGAGSVVTGVTAANGVVTVTKSEVTIPVGSPTTPTSRATIWVE